MVTEHFDRFDRALNELLRCNNIALVPKQTAFAQAIRAAVLHDSGNRESLLVRYPRMSGSWLVQAVVACALVLSQPDGDVVAFALTHRQARAWIAQVVAFLQSFEHSGEFGCVIVCQKRAEYVTIRSRGTNTTKTIAAFPANSNFPNVRGMGRSTVLVLVGDAAFVSTDAMPILLPMCAHGAALVMTTFEAAAHAPVPGAGPTFVDSIMAARFADGTSAVREVDLL